MLRQRVLTALTLIPLVAAGVLMLPTAYLGLIFGFVVLLAALEWAKLSGLESSWWQAAYLVAVAVSLVAAARLTAYPAWAARVLAVAAVCWLLVALGLLANRKRQQDLRLQGASYRQLAVGLLVVVGAWLAVVFLHGFSDEGPALLLFLMVLIWVSDSGAYFVGKRWGRTKLAPAISPGKTTEGVAGALTGALVCALAWSVVQGYALDEVPGFVLLCLITTLLSVAGDLFESLMKRLRGLKDSGNLLPGHGGVFDRIDSLTSAAPVFVSGLLLLRGFP